MTKQYSNGDDYDEDDDHVNQQHECVIEWGFGILNTTSATFFTEMFKGDIPSLYGLAAVLGLGSIGNTNILKI